MLVEVSGWGYRHIISVELQIQPKQVPEKKLDTWGLFQRTIHRSNSRIGFTIGSGRWGFPGCPLLLIKTWFLKDFGVCESPSFASSEAPCQGVLVEGCCRWTPRYSDINSIKLMSFTWHVFFSGVDREAAKVLFFTQSSSEKVQRACWELVYLFLSHAVFQIRPCCSFSASVPC